MHPVTYDISVRTQQLEIEHATRKAALLAQASETSVRERANRRIDNPFRRLVNMLTPRRT